MITTEQKMSLYKTAGNMADSGLAADFIEGVVSVAVANEGCYELVELWAEAENQSDKDAVIADLQELIDEAAEATPEPIRKPKIDFNDLDKVIDQILKDKAKLNRLIESAGGQSEISRRTGIPQPSLSRMLSSASMPRRRTLYKIALAMDVSEFEVITEWLR